MDVGRAVPLVRLSVGDVPDLFGPILPYGVISLNSHVCVLAMGAAVSMEAGSLAPLVILAGCSIGFMALLGIGYALWQSFRVRQEEDFQLPLMRF